MELVRRVEMMAKYKKKPKRRRPASAAFSKDPVKRQHQLANLSKSGRRTPTKAYREVMKEYRESNIIKFAEAEFYIPETRQPIRLLKWEKEFFIDLFYRKVKPTLALLGTPKKCGKSTIAAIVALYMLVTKRDAEIYILGPDLEQSTLVVYNKIRKAIRLNPRLRDNLTARKDYITDPRTDSFIRPLACSSTNAGLNPTLCIFDELWRFTSEEALSTYDEMTNIPTRGSNLNLIVSYAGFSEDEDSILYRLYKHGIDQQEGVEKLDKQFLFRWYGEDLYNDIPWVTKNYLTLQRGRLRPNTYARYHQNLWVSGSESFIDSTILDQCTHGHRKGQPFSGQVCVGIDIGLRHDASAIAVVGRVDSKTLILVDHKIFVPDERRHQTLDLESTVERVLLQYHSTYKIKKAIYDPYQFARSAATMKNAGIKMMEFPQTVSNTCEMSETLSDLLHNQRLLLYADKTVRQHLLNARVKETQRGWRLVKAKASRKIDLTVALALACLGAQRNFLTKSGKKGHVVYAGEETLFEEAVREARQTSDILELI